MSTSRIFTNDNCVGCNLCISKCPCEEANVALMEDGKNRVYVDDSKCIACGECLRCCIHNARDYADETGLFFEDLEAGVEIPLVAAPALRSNIPEWPRLLGYLKSVGVNAVYDASYGADICTWAYLRYITENDVTGLISQPCPAIVNYIEHYVPELLSRLAPIHSPAMCAATYMKKYKGIPGPYAFLSPCVGKRDEFHDHNTEGLYKYNVTFKKLMEYLTEKGVDYRKYAPAGYDNEEHGLGSIYSSPGGLKENIEQHGRGRWIYQVEGQPNAFRFLHEYAGDRGDAPFLIDILNCSHGCNAGTGACRMDSDAYAVGRAMHAVQQASAKVKPDYAQFDKELRLPDFMRRYAPKRNTQVFVDRYELERAFAALHKPTHEFRVKECRNCGYLSCEKMAAAIAKGINHVDNCSDYIRSELKLQSGGSV